MPENFIHRFQLGDQDAPVLLLLHGTGGTENDLLELGHSFAPNASLISPRGKILENGMPRFFRRLAEGVFDEPDLIFRTHELADFVQSMQAEHSLVGRPVIAIGYSNGANIAASILLLRPEILAGAVLLRAMVPLQPAVKPDLAHSAVFLAGGKSDPIIPHENTQQLAKMLEINGANITMHWTSCGHELHAQEIAAAKTWMSNHFPSI